MNKKLSRQEWIGLVDRFRNEDITQEQFAENEGVNLSTLRYWIYKLRGSVENHRLEISVPDVEFVEIHGEHQSDSSKVLIRISALTIELQSLPHASWIAELLRELSRDLLC